MTAAVSHAAPGLAREESPAGVSLGSWLLLAGLSSAAVMDAVNSTVLSIARAQMMGSSHAAPDEIAWINIAYFIAKLTTFPRSEEHTSELQSLMRISYAVFCLQKNKKRHHKTTHL